MATRRLAGLVIDQAGRIPALIDRSLDGQSGDAGGRSVRLHRCQAARQTAPSTTPVPMRMNQDRRHRPDEQHVCEPVVRLAKEDAGCWRPGRAVFARGVSRRAQSPPRTVHGLGGGVLCPRSSALLLVAIRNARKRGRGDCFASATGSKPGRWPGARSGRCPQLFRPRRNGERESAAPVPSRKSRGRSGAPTRRLRLARSHSASVRAVLAGGAGVRPWRLLDV